MFCGAILPTDPLDPGYAASGILGHSQGLACALGAAEERGPPTSLRCASGSSLGSHEAPHRRVLTPLRMRRAPWWRRRREAGPALQRTAPERPLNPERPRHRRGHSARRTFLEKNSVIHSPVIAYDCVLGRHACLYVPVEVPLSAEIGKGVRVRFFADDVCGRDRGESRENGRGRKYGKSQRRDDGSQPHPLRLPGYKVFFQDDNRDCSSLTLEEDENRDPGQKAGDCAWAPVRKKIDQSRLLRLRSPHEQNSKAGTPSLSDPPPSSGPHQISKKNSGPLKPITPSMSDLQQPSTGTLHNPKKNSGSQSLSIKTVDSDHISSAPASLVRRASPSPTAWLAPLHTSFHSLHSLLESLHSALPGPVPGIASNGTIDTLPSQEDDVPEIPNDETNQPLAMSPPHAAHHTFPLVLQSPAAGYRPPHSNRGPPQRVALVPDCMPTAIPRILTLECMQSIVDSGALPLGLRESRWVRLYSAERDGSSFNTFLAKVAGCVTSVIVGRTRAGDVLGGFVASPWSKRGRMDTILAGGDGFYGTGEAFLFEVTKRKVDGRRMGRLNQSRVRADGCSDFEGSFESEHDVLSGQTAPEGSTDSVPVGEHKEDLAETEKQQQRVNIYRWTGANQYFQLCDIQRGRIAMGGGGEESDFGICFEDDFSRGSSGPCDTFGNWRPLAMSSSSTCSITSKSQRGRNAALGGGCTSTSFDLMDFEVYGFINYAMVMQSYSPQIV